MFQAKMQAARPHKGDRAAGSVTGRVAPPRINLVVLRESVSLWRNRGLTGLFNGSSSVRSRRTFC